MVKKMKKITIIGDITCDRPLLEATRIHGEDSFSGVFSKVKPLLASSDYVVANFETVCAGSSNDFQNEFFLYNTPDDIIPAMKDAGVDFVTTANNHCLDQGIEGLKRTIDVLDQNGIAHIGTFASLEDRLKNQIVDVDGVNIALLAYTTSTNESNTGVILDESNDYLVGLLRKQRDSAKDAGGIKSFLAKHLNVKQRRALQRIVNRTKLKLGIPYFKPYTDQITKNDTPNNPYLVKVRDEIKRAKEQANIVIVCPHMGGQFNTEPGTYSEFIINYLKECGADVIAGNHPHVVQKVDMDGNCIAAYSVGGFNLSVSADYIVHESLPEYSMALHVYVDREAKQIDHAAFSILKIIEDEKHLITVYPIHQLPSEMLDEKTMEDIAVIYNRITGRSEISVDIIEEYPL